MRKILVTSALPYANGAIHLGHLVEYIQTDIWVRFQKLQNNQCYYVCASDAHGTPIMLKAEKDGITPQQLIDTIHAEHSRDFAGFGVDFDNFYSTHSTENEEQAQLIYQRLKANGYISDKVITQAYDPVKNMFLPDRFVKGECPRCHAKDQYGDNCENCGATYDPTDLINPISVVSGQPPISKDSKHYFFDLPKLEVFLKNWLNTANIQAEIKNKMQEWFDNGLQSWDISRDAPYWGFKIPDTEDKYFYVWLDAPIGYMASFRNFANKNGLNFDEYWNEDSDVELYHFIGKDIAYFHTLFWPATLEGSGYRKPNGVFCHGFLMVNGAKMSKSRGTFITAETYLKHLNPEFLRYYYASKLSASVEDIDLSLDDFIQKNNSDLVGKLVNLASRCAGFISKSFAGQLAGSLDNPALFDDAAKTIKTEIMPLYEAREYAQVVRKIMALADKANEYIDAKKPWVLIKSADSKDEVQSVCTTGINLFYQLIIALKPILPNLASEAEAFMQCQPLTFADTDNPLLNQQITTYQPLLQRIEAKAVTAMVEDSKESLQTDSNPAKEAETKASDNELSVINIDDFMKVDLRVAKVIEANHVEGADKLIQLKLDVGTFGQRQVFAGIKAHYDPTQLLGRHVVLVANLLPRKMKFGLSEGMILCASNDSGIFALSPDTGAKPGDKVK